MNTDKPPLVVIAGPTASGKSALALALSRLQPSVIINADASQVYSDLRIVSARPTAEEEAEVPHQLFGYLDGSVNCTAARWARDAAMAIREVQAASRLPILVGGTGLYLRTLLEGIAPIPDIDPAIRAEVRSMPVEAAFTALRSHDPEAADRLNPNDKTRIMRALEVIRSTGNALGFWQSKPVGGIQSDVNAMGTILLPPRDWLRERCDARFDWMLENGGMAEVSALLERRLDVNLPVMRAIGVPEIAQMIIDPSQRAACVEQAKAATRQYAKRQYTWFRNQPPEDWERIEAQLNPESIDNLVIKLREMTLTS